MQAANPSDTLQPLMTYFQQMDDVVQFTDDTNNLTMPQQILDISMFVIMQTDQYIDAIKQWNAKDPADKDWTNFKTLFAKQYHGIQE